MNKLYDGCVIWWIRRDFRLADNQALQAALSSGKTVIPLFILDPHLLRRAAPYRQAFLLAGLSDLDNRLRTIGSRLIMQQGPPAEILPAFFRETGASAVFAEEDLSPYARRRDREAASLLPLQLLHGVSIQPPMAVLKADGAPYTVFTPFSRAWKSRPLPTQKELFPAPLSLAALPKKLPSLPLPHPAPPADFPAGEDEAGRRLQRFLSDPESGIFRYSEGRHRLDIAGTSGLSPYLRFGMLSARQAAVAAMEAMRAAPDADSRRGAETWLEELIWRDFYLSILYHFPAVLREPFKPFKKEIAWRQDEDAFARWKEGRTGYPVVDAAMRQLHQRGWLPNRARMISASFLSKDLWLDWRLGESWFMEQLVDGDPAANNGGWQWVAGTGADAAPYFRIFNPVTQSRKFDPEGVYIRRWLPELQSVPAVYIHEPWRMPAEVQQAAHCRIGLDYPAPLVDHAEARRRALAAYRQNEDPTSGLDIL